MKKFFRLIFFAWFILFPSYSHLEELEINNSSSLYGGVGLIQTPSARFDDDGEFAFGISNDDPFKRIYSKMQFFPWLEVVLKYSELENTSYEGLDQTAKDKGLDAKIRILKETNNLPSIAIGFNDIGGNGYFASEYIVATKNFGNLDFNIGMGWGKLSGLDHISNPLRLISDSFDLRSSGNFGGGALNLNTLFSGERVSVFGGIEYSTPIPNLSLKLEYDTTDYSYSILQGEKDFRTSGDLFKVNSRFNYGINYRINASERDKIDLSLGYVRGDALYANVTLHSNLNFKGTPRYTAPPEKLNTPYLKPFDQLNKKWQRWLYETIIWQMANEGMVTHSIIFNDNDLQVEMSQGRFTDAFQAIDLASRILANNSPKNIEKITVINLDQGIETLRTTIDRKELVESVAKGPLDELLVTFNPPDSLSPDRIIKDNEYLYPNFYWEIKPHLLGTLQHQIQFYFWQLEALIHTEYSIKKGLYLTTDIGIDISNNYENYTWHIADGELYHVRQNRRLYLTEGETGLRRMALDYAFSINRNLKAKISLGYLEWMYGGFGGEILYTPDNKNWAIGFDSYWVKQRDYDQKFSFKDYEAVTGLMTFYYDLPFYDMRFKLSAGQFLAKDRGAHIDLSRRFETGARVGAIVALTDCDSQCVGEGSFNKWIYFNLPMDLFYTRSTTKSRAVYAWSPLTKDAGQRVDFGGLYEVVNNAGDSIDTLRRRPWSLRKIISGFGSSPKDRL